MLLTGVQVRMYRNIVDSGVVAIEDRVTCLVGKNESGKTALLSAVYRVNPVYPKDRFESLRDYPRWRYARDRRDARIDTTLPVTAVFRLLDGDLDAIEEALGPGVLTDARFEVSLSYTGERSYAVNVDASAAVRNLYDAVETPQPLIEAIGAIDELGELLAGAETLSAPPEGGDYSAADLDALKSEARKRLAGHTGAEVRVVEMLRSRMPRFFYFGEYQTLPGRIDVGSLAGKDEPGATAIQTARALLKLADTDASSLTDEDFEDRKAELEAVSNELTKEVSTYWTQNQELSVEIDLDKVTERTPQGQHAVARYLDLRVKDRRHGFTNNFGQRSSGFQWFFSFLAAFSEFESSEYGVVVLLDEPALTLHGRAQSDFLRFIDERLASEAQVVYTTHSPFMVEPAKLDRVRIIEDRGPEDGAAVTEDVFSVSDESLFPLQAALGYDIAQSLFVGPDNLLVEGTSDFTYLTLMSGHLEELGRTHLNERWRVLPAGGATNIPTFVALIGRSLQVTVLVDGGPPAVAKLKNLADRGLLARKRLLLTDSFTDGVAPSDIEDLFSVEDYLILYNAAFGASLKATDLQGTDRVIARISRATGRLFTEHGRPADALLHQRNRLIPSLSETTLRRFEALFSSLNGMLE